MKHWTEVSARWHLDYERGRPGDPHQVVDVPGLPASATVLEVGAGIGTLTRLPVTRLAHVLAVEPDPAMRRLLAALCPGAPLIGGTAEQVPLADGIDTLPSSERATLLDRVRFRLTASAYRLPFETHVHLTRLRSGAVG